MLVKITRKRGLSTRAIATVVATPPEEPADDFQARADEVVRRFRKEPMTPEHSQGEVRAWLLREHGLTWSNTRLRAALAGFRQALLPFVADLQVGRLLTWLQQAELSRGRHRPVLAAGRDGIMIPVRLSKK